MSYNKFCCWFVNVEAVHQTTPKCCGKDFLFFFTYGNNKFIWNLFNCLKRSTNNSCINFFIEKLAIFIDKMRTAVSYCASSAKIFIIIFIDKSHLIYNRWPLQVSYRIYRSLTYFRHFKNFLNLWIFF